MLRGNAGFDFIAPGGRKPGHQSDPFCHLSMVPEHTVLVIKREQLAIGSQPGGTTGVLQQKEREQSAIAGILWHEPGENAGQSDRFCAQIPPNEPRMSGRRIAFGEDQVDDRLHGGKTLGQHFQRGKQEGAGNLGSGEAPRVRRVRAMRAS